MQGGILSIYHDIDIHCQSGVKVHSNANVFVNAPYFNSLTHQIRGAYGLPWWSPSKLLATICCVCSIEKCVRACTALCGNYYSVHIGNKAIFTSYHC